VLDISMPGLSGIDIAKQIQEEELPTRPVILTMHNDEVFLDEAMERGVTGYLLKDSTLTEIIDCIKTVAGGGYYISKELTEYLIKGKQHRKNRGEISELTAQLTATEKHIVQLLSQNKTSAQIAKELFISYRTVQNHRQNISHKLGLTGYNSLLLFAIQHKAEL
jgi:DNA-binding NarL/FixJ family response regulator